MREKRGYLWFLPALCTAAALSLDMGTPRYRGYPEFAWNPLFSLGQRPFLPLFFAAFFLYRAVSRRTGKTLFWLPLLLWNAFAAFVWLLAEGFRLDETCAVLFSTTGQQVKSALYFIGITCGLQCLSALLYVLLTRGEPANRPAAAVPEDKSAETGETKPTETEESETEETWIEETEDAEPVDKEAEETTAEKAETDEAGTKEAETNEAGAKETNTNEAVTEEANTKEAVTEEINMKQAETEEAETAEAEEIREAVSADESPEAVQDGDTEAEAGKETAAAFSEPRAELIAALAAELAPRPGVEIADEDQVLDLPAPLQSLWRKSLRFQTACRRFCRTVQRCVDGTHRAGMRMRDLTRRAGERTRDLAGRARYGIRMAWRRVRQAALRVRGFLRDTRQTLRKADSFIQLAVQGAWRVIRRVCGWTACLLCWCGRGIAGAGRWFWNHCPFLASFLALALCWTPHLLISYPASLTPSAWNQLEQYFGLRPWTNFHPPASTLLLGQIVEWGTELGTRYGLDAPGNLGLFLYAVFQSVFLAAVLARVFRLMHTLRSPRWLLWTTFLCCILVPYYTAYLSTLLKDNLYSACFLLMAAELSVMALQGRDSFTDWRHIPLWWLAVPGALLLRHNGKYIVWPTIFLLALMCLRAVVRNPKKEWYRASFALVWMLLPVLASLWISGTLAETFHIEPGSVREAFSLPFQQTARYVKYYSDDVTEEERARIDAVLDYDNLAKNYDPRLADPVKDTYREEADRADRAAYFGVWFVHLLRHPDAYVLATAHQNYYLIYPFVPNESVFTGLDESGRAKTLEALQIQPAPELKKAQFNLNHWYRVSFWIPGVSLASHLAAYTLLFFWLALLSLRRKLYRWLLPAFPVFLSLGVTVAAPVIQGHPRYAFPVVYTIPLLTALWMALARRQNC